MAWLATAIVVSGTAGVIALQGSGPSRPSAIRQWVRHVEVSDAAVLKRDFHAFANPPTHSSKAHLRELCVQGRRDLATISTHRGAPYRGVQKRYARILAVGSALYFNCLSALDHHSRRALARIHGLVVKFEASATTFDRFARRFHVRFVE